MTKILAAGLIISDIEETTIYGAGDAVDAAWLAVLDRNLYTASPASAALIAQVVVEGGEIAWAIVNGVACTVDEAEESDAAYVDFVHQDVASWQCPDGGYTNAACDVLVAAGYFTRRDPNREDYFSSDFGTQYAARLMDEFHRRPV